MNGHSHRSTKQASIQAGNRPRKSTRVFATPFPVYLTLNDLIAVEVLHGRQCIRLSPPVNDKIRGEDYVSDKRVPLDILRL